MAEKRKEPEARMTIRRGKQADAAVLAELHRDQEWCYDDAAIVSQYFDDTFEPLTVIGADVEGELVGKIELFLGWKSASGRFGVIRRFVVHPDWRGRGVGNRLLAAAEEEARRAGCAFLELSVDEDNDGARRLYDSSGFTESRREIILRKSFDGREHPSLYRDQRPDCMS